MLIDTKVWSFWKNIVLIAVAATIASGCAYHKGLTKIKQEIQKSAYNWYNDAMQDMIYNNYDQAEHSFTLLIEQHSGTVYAEKALLRMGDLYFKQGEYRSAKASYSEFIKRYPYSKNVEYAYFMIGYSNFRMRYDFRHSQNYTKQAVGVFVKFINKYPHSSYKARAENMLSLLIEELENHELYVTKFYLNTGKPSAALIRLNYAQQRYNIEKLKNRSIFYRMQTLIDLKHFKKAKQLLYKLSKNSNYFKKAETVLRKANKKKH